MYCKPTPWTWRLTMRRTRTAALVTLLAVTLSAGCADADDLAAGTPQQTLPPGGVAAAEEAARRAADGQQIGGTLNLLGLLSGTNLEQYLGVLAPLEKATGIDIKYETAGDLIAVLRTRVDGGNP